MPSAGNLAGDWCRLHTDACIVRALTESKPLLAVKYLDTAIVISGAAGQERIDLILDLIERSQSQCGSVCFPVYENQPLSPFPDEPIAKVVMAGRPIPVLPRPPSLELFRRIRHRPFIMRGYARDWPCLTDHPWASFHYLRTVGGPGRIVPVEIGKDYRTEDWTQTLMSWDEFISALDFPDQPSTRAMPGALYLAQHDIFMQFPKLRADLIVPDLVYSCPEPTDDFPHYTPPGNEEQLVINGWLGPRGMTSPAHTDAFFNVYVQAVGKKTIWLAHPSLTPYMYPYPARTSNMDDSVSRVPAANTTSPSMSNTTRVDVFAESSDEQQQFPEFLEKVVPDAMTAILEAGDALFFPPGWWHAMRSETTSFSISMWF
ncbi:Clavaminate synthase-like protein [Fistulina hepatica ATCC 64428]|nr:Clavaminate synthase-like protein [Fistulina hepatica ATCC 64428]